MTAEWHVSIDGMQRGPLTAEQIRSLATSGQLKPTDHIWKEGMSEWASASSVKGLFPQSPPSPPRPPASPPPSHAVDQRQMNPAAAGASTPGWVSFGEAVTLGLPKMFDFSGRASRSEFWWFYLAVVLVWLPILFMAINVVGVPEETMQVLAYVYYAVVASGIGARRLHDTNHSGWWQLLVLTGIGALVLLIWFCRKGTPAPNRFG